MTLTDFLLAQIAEDEAAAERGGSHNGGGSFANDNYGCLLIDPVRVLAECEAKRRIVEAYIDTLAMIPTHVLGDGDEHPTVIAEEYEAHILPALALPYADHPDYRDEWRR